MRTWLVALLCGLGISVGGPARAQLPDGIKPLPLFQAGMEAADKLVAAGEKSKARFVLLGIAPVIQKAQGQLPGDLLPRYEKAMNACWEPLTAANQADQAKAFQAAMDEFLPQLTRCAMDVDVWTPQPNWGFDQFAGHVLKAREVYPAAEKCAVDYSAKAGSPLLHLKLATNTPSWQVMTHLQRILVADGLWTGILKDNILPRSLQKAEEELARIDDAQTAPWAAVRQVDAARKLLGYALSADAKDARIKPVQAKLDAAAKRAEERVAAQIAANRFPSDGYQGPGADALREQLRALYTRRFPDEKLLKLAIRSDDWVENAEAWWDGDVLKSGVFRWLQVAVAVAAEGGQARVRYLRVGRQWTGRGDDYGEPYYNRTDLTYAMLAGNL